MVNKRADFHLAEFTSEKDFSSEIDGIRLIPVPNIKVGLDSSRHFVVSKKQPDSMKIFEALQKGLKILREKGMIRKAFEESGHINTRVKDWKLIFP